MNESYPRSERRDAAENRQRILTTALQLFEQQGVDHVSMNQIATAARIGPGTLYRRYRNKSELCLDLIKDSLVSLFDDIDAYLAQHQTMPPRDRLKEVLRLFISYRERKLQLLAGVEEGASVNGPRSTMQSPLYVELHEVMVNLFREMGLTGETGSNGVFRADMLLTALKNDAYVFQRDVRGYSPDAFLEQLRLTFFPD
ncbi:TetR/AcrR family transcriptional regulator [Sulfobacillus harzensis]|uniref:TetR/AcrR family transcriptional regulator n=1 Tax=Sulfobacillus harzensis TaxID=2729629 RepID=A0A7Y0Q466_9FIRM|nr:TetR/AcrR family transcriptional regulator [Sulfobacillus harzensis]NMP24302.1 TetR/AcrR family transcriptional regulator [Sulfobacillus harzensis]